MSMDLVSDDDVVDAEIVEDEPAISKERREFIDGLRAFANFLEERPSLIPIYSLYNANYPAGTREELAKKIRELGTAEKEATDYHIGSKRRFGPHSLSVYMPRNAVCEQVVVGQKEVVKVVDSASQVPENARNVRTITTTQVVYDATEDVVEMKCPPSLLRVDEETPEIDPAFVEEHPF